jgi:myosin heavy subunit
VSRSVRSLISKSGKDDKDKDGADDMKSVRSRDNVKITRHAHRARADTNDSQDILRDQTSLEQEVVNLKLLIANARTEEEEERHHARRVANVNDRLRNLYEEQKNRSKQAKEDVDRLEKELERMRKLKAKVAPQIQQNRIKAWHNRRRLSNDGDGSRGPTPTRTRRAGARRSYASGASVSSWSVGNSIGESLVSVHSLFERVERGLAGLEQETVETSESGY